MEASLVNPFIESAVNVLKTMAQTTPVSGAHTIKKHNRTWGEVTGLIGMAGENVNGNMMVSFDAPCILSIVSKMLMEEFTEINNDVIDAVGEITNMISGGTKSALKEKGFAISMATPIIINGKNVELSQNSKSPIICIPFTTEVGQFVIEANLAKCE